MSKLGKGLIKSLKECVDAEFGGWKRYTNAEVLKMEQDAKKNLSKLPKIKPKKKKK
jgi:hypothetical protein